MKRLTKRTGKAVGCNCDNCDKSGEMFCSCEIAALNRLAEYEDAEEQGLLVRLPCKVGDTVYVVGKKYRAGRYEKWINTGRFNLSDLDKLGKTVFLTREEAKRHGIGG